MPSPLTKAADTSRNETVDALPPKNQSTYSDFRHSVVKILFFYCKQLYNVLFWIVSSGFEVYFFAPLLLPVGTAYTQSTGVSGKAVSG